MPWSNQKKETYQKMNIETISFDARELCSRKLWQLVNTPTPKEIGENELQEAIAELASRRHYMQELQRIGKL
jgi:hypothetical protein